MSPQSRKTLEWDMANTIIEDSEPERMAEEERLREECRQRRRITRASKKEKDAAIAPAPSHPSLVSIHQRSSQSTTETSDLSEYVSPESSKSPIKTPLPAPFPEQEAQGNSILPTNSIQDSDIDLLVRPINLANCISSSKEEVTKPNLDLARFAFSKTDSGNTFTEHGVSQKLSMPATKVQKNTINDKPSKSTSLPAFATEFTAQQLNGLLKCVVCDLPWTVRKTAPMKLTHIKTCARKNGWAETTVKARLALLIEQTPPLLSNTKAIHSVTTLLEDVMNQGAPKKKRKKSKERAVTTVMDPHDAHQLIIERAKTLFAQASLDNIQEEGEAPATQTFPATRLGVPGSGFLESAMEEEHEAPVVSLGTTFPVSEAVGGYLPTATQPFKPSALGERFKGNFNLQLTRDVAVCSHEAQARESSEVEHANLMPSPNFLRQCSSPSFISLYKNSDAPRLFHTANEGAYSSTSLNKKLEDINRRLAVFHLGSYDTDKKYITLAEQEDSVTKKRTNSKGKERGRPAVVTVVPFSKKSRNRSSSCSSSSSRPLIRNSLKPSKNRSKSPRKIRNRDEADKYFNDAVEEMVRRIILSNSVLYHKILCYEPIHFEQLVQIPALKEFDGPGFKAKLIKFLDKHAINFYGDSSLATGRRARYK